MDIAIGNKKSVKEIAGFSEGTTHGGCDRERWVDVHARRFILFMFYLLFIFIYFFVYINVSY